MSTPPPGRLPFCRPRQPISNCSYPGEAAVQVESEWQNGPVHDSVLAFGSTRRMIHALAASYQRQHGVGSVNWLVPNAYGPETLLDRDTGARLNGSSSGCCARARRGSDASRSGAAGDPCANGSTWTTPPASGRVPRRRPQIDPSTSRRSRAVGVRDEPVHRPHAVLL